MSAIKLEVVDLEDEQDSIDEICVETPVKKRAKYNSHFRDNWITEFPGITESKKGTEYAFCTTCEVHLSVRSGGRNDLMRHLKTKLHNERAEAERDNELEGIKIEMANNDSSQSSDEDLDKMRQELDRLTEEEAAMKKELAKKNLILKIDEKRNSIKRLKNELETSTIAFTAVLTNNLTGLGIKQTIVFDSVVTNLGDCYNANTGIFTAPINGVYSFNMDILQSAGNDQYLEFVKDGQHLMWNYANAIGASEYIPSSRTLVTVLVKGNQIWVRTGDENNHGSGKVWGNCFSSFTGWLIAINE